MRKVLLLVGCLLAGCGPRKAPSSPTGGTAPTPPPSEHLAVEAVIWTAESSEIDPHRILDKEGTLRRTAAPDPEAEGQVKYWPFSLDYWGIMRTDLEDVLKPYIGRTVRVEGEFRKTYAHEKWLYEVDPVRITLLPTP